MAYEAYWASLQRRARHEFHPATHLRQTAKVLHLSKAARHRLEWFIYYKTVANENARLTCRHFGLTPKTFYAWRKRYETGNLHTLEERPRATTRSRARYYTSEQYGRVTALRREHLRWGKTKLLTIYRTRYSDDRAVTDWQIQKMIERSGLYYHPQKNARTQAKRRRAHQKKRITELRLKPRTGFLLCLDTMVRHWTGKQRYIFTAVDRYTKLAFARMYTTKSSLNSRDFLYRLHALTDGHIENVGHDNGSEFQGDFAKACQRLTLPQYHSRVKTPTDNAVNERFNRTLDEEFIRMGNMTTDTAVFNRTLTEWLIEYNTIRPHQSLNYLSPIQFIEQHHKVLPLTSSSTND